MVSRALAANGVARNPKETDMPDTTAPIKCTYCGKAGTKDAMWEKPVIQQKFLHGSTRVVKEYYWFCRGTDCAGNYQMGCEG